VLQTYKLAWPTVYLINYAHLIAGSIASSPLSSVASISEPGELDESDDIVDSSDTSSHVSSSSVAMPRNIAPSTSQTMQVQTARKTVHSPGRTRHTANAYRQRMKKRQARSDIGPKTRIRKLQPLKRGPDGKVLRRRNYHCLSLYSIHLTLAMALSEIRHYQKEGGLVFSRAAFNRLIKELCDDLVPLSGHMRWRASALAALQYAAETALCMHFEMLYRLILGPC
jgi:histone H3/H4